MGHCCSVIGVRNRAWRLALSAAVLGACAFTPPAHAVLVSGTFAGTAAGTTAPQDVTGTFRVNIPTAPWWDDPTVAPPFGEITFRMGEQAFRFLAGPDQPDAPGAISIGALPQSITFGTSVQPRFDGAMLTFTSADGSMFRDGDFGSLAIDGRTVSQMDVSFASAAAGLALRVDVRSFRFDGLVSPVDEPAVGAMMLAGLALLAAGRSGLARRGRPASSGLGFRLRTT